MISLQLRYDFKRLNSLTSRQIIAFFVCTLWSRCDVASREEDMFHDLRKFFYVFNCVFSSSDVNFIVKIAFSHFITCY